jgi:hypothetical protein
MNTSSGLKIARRLGKASVILFAAGLLFRFALYRHMYIAPDAPYGASDLVEFVLGCILILLVSTSVLFGLFLAVSGPKENRVAGAWLLFTCAAIAALEAPLHTLAAKWAP